MKIRLENITKAFNLPNREHLTVLKDISLEISEGDFVMILGESGCGKSTLLNIIAGLMPLTSGAVFIDNMNVKGPDPSRAIIFQQPSLLPWLNVEENIMFGCRLRGEKDNLKERTSQLIEIMKLSGSEKTYPSGLSLGMAQRVCLARTLIGHPQILLLDEPFSSLDTFNRTHLQDELLEFWHVEQFTAVFVTHDIDEAILMGNKIVLLGYRPCRIIETFHIDLNYPRDMTNESFFHLRTKILNTFRKALSNNLRN